MDTHIYGNTFLFARTKKSTSAHFNDVISLFASRQNGKAGHAPAAAGLSRRAASAACRGAPVCLPVGQLAGLRRCVGTKPSDECAEVHVAAFSPVTQIRMLRISMSRRWSS